MKTIYLDQNQWIRIARAVKYPDNDSVAARIAATLRDSVNAGQCCLPLTGTTIYETYKINNDIKRQELAFVQSSLSCGKVIVGRRARIGLPPGKWSII